MSDGRAERVHRIAVGWLNTLEQRAAVAAASLPEDVRAGYLDETRELVTQAKAEMGDVMGEEPA